MPRVDKDSFDVLHESIDPIGNLSIQITQFHCDVEPLHPHNGDFGSLNTPTIDAMIDLLGRALDECMRLKVRINLDALAKKNP